LKFADGNSAYAQQAVEPVFSIQDPFSFHTIHNAFRGGFADPAFSNAVMFAISFSESGHGFTSDCLNYQGRAIRQIHKQLNSLSSLDSTVGAILLLVGVEVCSSKQLANHADAIQWRLGIRQDSQIHLKGIEKVLEACNGKGIDLSSSTRRGIFWQDLNIAIVTATDRVLSRNAFPELQWGRQSFMVSWSQLPSGFAAVRNILGDAAEVVQDISVLQYTCENGVPEDDPQLVYKLDNDQACIESRLHDSLLKSINGNCVLISILLASYLYTYSLFTSIWNGFWIPFHISKRMLEQLQTFNMDVSWKGYEEVWLWCSIIGGCLSPPGEIRSLYANLLSKHCSTWSTQMMESWNQTEHFLELYYWSRKRFTSQGRKFWEDSLSVSATGNKSESKTLQDSRFTQLDEASTSVS
jgi:hypothetical protein